jgi:two-component system, NarL family, sensor histidine kinase EvgS
METGTAGPTINPDDLLTTAADAADLFAFQCDLATQRVHWGRGAERLLCGDPQSRQQLRDLIHPEDLPEFIEIIESAKQSTGKVWARARILRQDGMERWTVIRGGLNLSSEGGPTTLRAMITDIHEQRLEELEADHVLRRYRAVLDAIPDRVWSKDVNAKFDLLNHAYVEMSSLPAEKILGASASVILDEASAQRSQAEDERVLREGVRTRSEETRILHGKPYRLEVLKSPIRDDAGNVVGIAGMTHDITESYQLRESLTNTLKELETLLATCPTGICIVRHRVIERCNPAAAAMLGYEPSELVGQPSRMLYPDEHAWTTMGEHLYSADNATGITSKEMQFRRKDGSRIWVLMISRIIDRATQYGVGAWIDISEQKKLADALIAARDAADVANRAKSSFVATVSHEIRTPLNGILGMLELLELSKMDPEHLSTVNDINESARSLLGLIDNILDFSKIEAGQIEVRAQPFDPAQLVNQCNNLYREIASRKHLVLKVRCVGDIPRALIGDSLKIRQIVNNMLSNAIKFTDAGDIQTTLMADAVSTNEHRLRITVSDSGIGIEPSVLQRLFQPFMQADSGTTRRHGGTGLGLSICKRLANAMGGSMTLQSQPGEGSTVVLELTLPAAPQAHSETAVMADEAARRPRTPVALANSPRKRLLIAEDHPVNLRLLARQLKQLGLDADLAMNGLEALKLWEQGDYVALITDCHMPEMDGFALARAIRTRERLAQVPQPVPILACTASALEEEVQACKASGMNDVMIKPLSVAGLESCLTRWIASTGNSPVIRQ